MMAKSKKIQTTEEMKKFPGRKGFKKVSLPKRSNAPFLEKYKKKIGTYVFVVNEDFCINYDEFMKEVTGRFVDSNGDPRKETYLIVPDFNFKDEIDEKGVMYFEEGKIFYIGSSDDLRKRIGQHINSDTLSGTASLRLGFKTREEVKQHLDIYIKSNNKKVENDIRSTFGAYFGR